jgi:hypothetical protein
MATNQPSPGTQPPLVPNPTPPRDQAATTDTAPSQPTEPAPNLQSATQQQAFFQGRPVNVNFTPPTLLRTAVTSSFVPAPTTTAPSASSSNTSDALDPNQTDPPAWDTNDQDAHSIEGVSPNAVKRKKKKKKRASLLISTTWTHARFDLDKIDEALDLDTGLFLPWDAPRPDYGRIRNFALYMPSLHLYQKVFLSSFHSGLAAVGFSRFDPKNLRQFQDAFPIFCPDMFPTILIGMTVLFSMALPLVSLSLRFTLSVIATHLASGLNFYLLMFKTMLRITSAFY